MTRLAVAIFAQTVDAALAQAALAAERGADMVEYRLDRFAEPPERAAELVNRSPLPCIVTCRPTWEGGEFEGDEESRLAALKAAANAGPAYIDLELAVKERHRMVLQRAFVRERDPLLPRLQRTPVRSDAAGERDGRR